MTIQNQNPLDENATMGSQTGSGLAQPSKTANKKLGLAIMLLGLLGVTVFALPSIIDVFTSEDKQDEQKVETKLKTTKEYQAPVIEKEVEQKTFSFDEVGETGEPIEKIGDIPEDVNKPPKLVKSMTGEMMNKVGGSYADSKEENSDIEDEQAVDKAIANANAYLVQNGEAGEPKEKISSNQSDVFTAPKFEATIARKSSYNPNLLLEQGTLIPCALRVRVVSNISGQMSCIITENVYSSNGNVLLIDKGSKVNGYYQGGSVNHGSNQLFVVWQEVRTPDNLIIPLNSGSTDELGANGLNGWVDNHFWERFSNAIFLSMILDGNNILLNKMTKTVANNTQETREAGKEIATTVLEQMGDIKPTLYKNQGDKIGIFVARDVDFSNVYKLKRR
ncbi:conjugal transfer protein TrbI [Pasteurella multocida]|uniref:type IV secretion system protein VirB10 n=1 Tax=Pasteurella multocida TaxID=747 RepID=UPI000CE882E0|nr:type IV secretion system protein VirB10 [Pasteurella multocida]PPE94934.1 conjugal transfer protein TrbI [Pasteurella multocida]PPE95027.1 conjugal transfer protein TrbI [Pasteurella multocida]HDR1236510.1 type IV secretion system protein VirB10 [Pasteurella multocida]HDR1500987.1 type IV secretion system protein VirB10 [Pasteurella multocida]